MRAAASESRGAGGFVGPPVLAFAALSAAGVAMVALVPGLPGQGTWESREAFIAGRPLAWQVCWGLVALAMAAFAGLLLWWAGRLHWTTGTISALLVEALALGADLAGIAWLSFVDPAPAARDGSLGIDLMCVVATPLHALAVVALLRLTPHPSPAMRLAAALVLAGGLVMAVSGAAGWPRPLLVGSAATFTAVPLLCLAVGRRFGWVGSGGKAHDYRMASVWNLRATPEELAAVFSDLASLERWWSKAFLRSVVSPDGRRVALHTTGWLPYTLRLDARIVEANCPEGFVVDTSGDLAGRCACRVERQGDRVRVCFDWRVRAHKPIVRSLSFALKPLFVSNHRWVMREGVKGLRAELRRRRAQAEAQSLGSLPRSGAALARR